MDSTTKIAPTISSGIAGPLGVLHLPRLWQKASLGAAGKLHGDYQAAGPGLDQLLLDGLGIEREDFLAFIDQQRPSYAELEKWLADRSEGGLNVAAVNQAIAGYEHDAEVRRDILTDAGIDSDAPVRDAITLNNLDDWAAFHRDLIIS